MNLSIALHFLLIIHIVLEEDFVQAKEFIKEAWNSNKITVISASYEVQARRLSKAFDDLDTELDFEDITDEKQRNINKIINYRPNKLYFTINDLSSGFETAEVLLITDREIFSRKKQFIKKMRSVKSSPIDSFIDLNEGDLVVHINHGIGKYIGIERKQIQDKEKDYILLLYQDKEKLYVPIEQMNLVQKYIGSDSNRAKLDKLGGKSWDKAKAKATKRAQEIAKELIEIYAYRQELKGTAFSPDTEWQHDFEANFPYEETPDQLNAIEEIKQDMEKAKPMDRLLCGDVGYGKTEVAMRACFKSVMDGKQVAILVPTTILCEQHFLNFKERFKDFPVRIEMVSRFRKPKEIKQSLKRLTEGGVDIIIGTHRVLSNDVHFKNLGLMIIDEEQRFGVSHKEKLKKMRTLIDVISMSATPIPRTLHMSLINIRDMSIINTPPDNRLPIETYTMEFNEDVIKRAISEEISRGGQCYFLFNRVKGIKSFAIFLMKMLPHVRFVVAHGQLEESELEEIIVDFIAHKYDVLITTTIIENGVDIPNVNTILIDRADSLGLSQLYQLRGRVGRSSRQAYCYMFYPADKALTELAQKRLAVLNEYTNIGGGFKIAMRDMEFRGAGNVLGPEQSGDIISIGFDLYCKILQDAVTELSTGIKPLDIDTYVDLNYDGFIPNSYISDNRQKIDMYKKIAAMQSFEEIDHLKEEFKDRFGELPDIVKNLIRISELKVIGNQMRITSITESKKGIMIEFNKHSKIDPLKISVLIKVYKKDIYIDPKYSDRLYIRVENLDLNKKVSHIRTVLEKLQTED